MTDLQNIQQQKRFNVLLVGDSCIDIYHYGVCERLSPEAPVPILKFKKSVSKSGMALNVKENLEALNVDVEIITNTETIKKIRYIEEKTGQHLLRVDEEDKLVSWNGNLSRPLEDYDAIVISDYNKGFLEYEHIEELRAFYNGPIFLDTKKTDLARFSGCIVKINELEYKNRSSINDLTIVTLGSDGAMLKKFEHEAIFPTKKVEVNDVCGCGDTFLSSLAVQYLFTKDIEKAIIFANVAAGITVQHRGNYAPTYDEIRNAGY